MGYFSCVSGLEMTAASVASLPVPEVVGMATSGGSFFMTRRMPFILGMGLPERATRAPMPFAQSMGEAAAESDDDVALVVVVELETLFDVGDGGVWG